MSGRVSFPSDIDSQVSAASGVFRNTLLLNNDGGNKPSIEDVVVLGKCNDGVSQRSFAYLPVLYEWKDNSGQHRRLFYVVAVEGVLSWTRLALKAGMGTLRGRFYQL